MSEKTPTYASQAFETDCAEALGGGQRALRSVLAERALSRGEHDRLRAGGADPLLLANLNVAGDLGTARVDLLHDGARFALGGPDPRLLLGVRDRDFRLIDIAALASHDENQWSLMNGMGDMLGSWLIDAAHAAMAAERGFRLRLFATPWDWLRGGGKGVCVLDWSGSALAELRGLRGGVVLLVDAGGGDRLRSILRHGDLPMVAEQRASMRQVA